MEIITQLASLGLGAVIAGMVLVWKRADDKRYSDSLLLLSTAQEVREERLLKILDVNTAALTAIQLTVESLVSKVDLERRIVALEATAALKERR